MKLNPISRNIPLTQTERQRERDRKESKKTTIPVAATTQQTVDTYTEE